MEMPPWEAFMLPTLRALSDGVVRSRREIYPLVARDAGLTEGQMQDALSSGQLTYQNRIGWALSFLTNVGALSRPSRGHYTLAQAGEYLLTRFPHGMREKDVRALGHDPSSPVQPYVASATSTAQDEAVSSVSSLTPTEQVQDGIRRINEEVAAELLTRLQGREPAFFEAAVVDLLLAMGYGGVGGSGSVTQLHHDGGVDGVIDQDVLGLSRVYIQAKRYASEHAVQRPEVQGFAGAVHGRADSGVFITTSRFSQGAKDFATMTPTRLVLIDGKLLADLMIRYGVGVQVRETYRIVEVDEDFFA